MCSEYDEDNGYASYPDSDAGMYCEETEEDFMPSSYPDDDLSSGETNPPQYNDDANTASSHDSDARGYSEEPYEAVAPPLFVDYPPFSNDTDLSGTTISTRTSNASSSVPTAEATDPSNENANSSQSTGGGNGEYRVTYRDTNSQVSVAGNLAPRHNHADVYTRATDTTIATMALPQAIPTPVTTLTRMGLTTTAIPTAAGTLSLEERCLGIC